MVHRALWQNLVRFCLILFASVLCGHGQKKPPYRVSGCLNGERVWTRSVCSLSKAREQTERVHMRSPFKEPWTLYGGFFGRVATVYVLVTTKHMQYGSIVIGHNKKWSGLKPFKNSCFFAMDVSILWLLLGFSDCVGCIDLFIRQNFLILYKLRK